MNDENKDVSTDHDRRAAEEYRNKYDNPDGAFADCGYDGFLAGLLHERNRAQGLIESLQWGADTLKGLTADECRIALKQYRAEETGEEK